MAKKISVLIPSRNEAYLTQTIQSCFDNGRGNLEVVVTLEGYWPSDWKGLTAKYLNLHTVHHGEPRGLRAAVNSAAASAISRGAEYLFKLDAHCMLDEGFDVKLLADIDDDWIVVPRRKRLDAVNWTVQDVGKPDVDYHYLSFPDDPNDFGGPGLNGKVWDQRIKERLGKPEYDIDDEMASQGSAWFMSVANFQRLELMDEANYGPFWNESQELFNKNWLSGGRCVVNKKTWYAHLHKSRTYHGADGKGGRGYTLPESWLQRGATFTKNWIWNDAWTKQTLPFEWLIDHFWPVPTWPENWRDILYRERKPRLVPVWELAKELSSESGATIKECVKDALSIRNLEEDTTSGSVKADDYAELLKAVDGEPLNIVSARYGILGSQPPFKDHSIDVRERVQSLVKNNSLDIIVSNSTLAPGQNPFRGKKKVLLLTYAWGDREGATVERVEKDWLIIGQPQRDIGSRETAELVASRDGRAEQVVTTLKKVAADNNWEVLEVRSQAEPPRTAPALNDYLIRKFSISPQRLRAPMPIELRDFHRNDLAQLFAELGFKRGAEIGVAEGNFSEVLLKANPECELLLVDPWHAYRGNPQNKPNDKHEFAYNEVLRKTKDYKRVDIRQGYSMDVVDGILYDSLDFVYVDANHLFDECVIDIIEWSKRVRSGGIVSGDDYYQLDQKRWVGGGVVEAVQAYVNAHRIPIWFICNAHRSTDYFWVKP